MVGHKRVSVIYVVAVAMNAVDLIKFAGGPREKKKRKEKKKKTHSFVECHFSCHSWVVINYVHGFN